MLYNVNNPVYTPPFEEKLLLGWLCDQFKGMPGWDDFEIYGLLPSKNTIKRISLEV